MENYPLVLLEKAISSGANIEQLERLLALQKSWEANEARKAFAAALADFKAQKITVTKNKTVGFNRTSYKHATLNNVIESITPALAEHGLSLRWNVEQNESRIRVTCILQHVLGHFETVTLEASADTSGSKNNIQAIGSTVTYLERYTALAITGTATAEQDDDGVNNEPATLINEQQLADLEVLISEVNADRKKLLNWLQLDDLAKLPENKLNSVIAAIERKRQEQKNAG